MNLRLNLENLQELPEHVKKPSLPQKTAGILHFGVGGFHRAHQAYLIQCLLNKNLSKYDQWSIAGAGILPQDKSLIESLRKQDYLYSLKSSSTEGDEEVNIIASISNLYYGPTQSLEIIDKIASEETKIVSFTITEGGYMIDEATGKFKIDHPAVISDLSGGGIPKTVFGYLARGMARRKEKNLGRITFLSCDNVQENGHVLQYAFLTFLYAYDRELHQYVVAQVIFPNSMVDRITPVTSSENKNDFERTFGYRDECLVISEDFCQWIIEEADWSSFPPLQEVGVQFVKDVRPYEKMKLRILNGGHNLVGLVGLALGHTYIHTAVKDELVSKLFDVYIEKEVLPSLEPIDGVSYDDYYQKVKNRFGNEKIPDTISRVISFASAKIPKFILPVLAHSVSGKKNHLIGSLVLAAWWYYLNERINENRTEEIEDALRDHWENIFSSSLEESVVAFLNTTEVFGDLGSYPEVLDQVVAFSKKIELEGIVPTVRYALDLQEAEI